MENREESMADINPFSKTPTNSTLQFENGVASKFNPNELFYNMSGLKYLLIFNHYTFKSTKFFSNMRPSDRRGTEEDVAGLKKVFIKMNYKVFTYNDFVYEDIMKTIKTVTQQDHSQTACLCVAILTHGDRNNELYAADMPYSLRDITVMFENGHKSLVGKPKLFFIQACRGDQLDGGRTLQTDGYSSITLPSSADFLFLRSSVEGFYSFRNMNGSFLIQELCRALEENYERKDIHYIITLVNKSIAFNYNTYTPNNMTTNKKKQMPEVTHTLTKLLMF